MEIITYSSVARRISRGRATEWVPEQRKGIHGTSGKGTSSPHGTSSHGTFMVHPHNRARRRLATENYILPATVKQSPNASRGDFVVTHGWIVDSPEGGGLGPGRGSKGTPGALGVNSPLCGQDTNMFTSQKFTKEYASSRGEIKRGPGWLSRLSVQLRLRS